MVFGSILVVQIVAHLPLSEINLPVNAHQIFQVMTSITSFDYFSPFELLDVGFTEVWAYSENFEWSGYESVNFLIELGSIGVFAAIQFIAILIALLTCRIRCPCKWARKACSGKAVWSGSLAFIHGTFFEIMITATISFGMTQYWDHFNSADHTSIVLTFVFYVILGLYLLFGLYFVFCKSGKLALVSRA